MAVIKIAFCVTALALMVTADRSRHERQKAMRSPTGRLLCPLGEEFYSYSLSANYGPSRWGDISECCLGSSQSPINLQNASLFLCENDDHSYVKYSHTGSLHGILHNTGYDPVVSFRGYDTAHLYDVPFNPGEYILDNLHIHYCLHPGKGSEHAIDGRFYTGEIHLVHYKASYGSLANAVLHDDGLVLVAIMLQVTSLRRVSLNVELLKLIHVMVNLGGFGEDHHIPVQVHVDGLLPKSRDFFTYHGSLTSPPCSESVRWVVFRNPIYISHYELEILRSLPSIDGGLIALSCNDRPLQVDHTIKETNFGCSNNIED